MQYKNKWIVNATSEQMRNSPIVNEIAKELRITIPTAQLLVNRGCMTPMEAESFLKKEEEQLHDPFMMLDMDNAAYRIIEGIENGDKIVIYGDYDVDGVTSVSCLYLYLREHGADVSYYIPCRSGEGYGMSEGAVSKLHDDGCNLIITVDTGITAVEEAKLARELGMDLIITDHHECHTELPEAEAVVNPRRSDCTYPFKELAGVGVVFKLLCALESVLNPEDSMLTCVRRVSKDYGDLVAIGTVADVMPIRDENRLIVSYGLSLIENTSRPGLIELIDATRGDSKYSGKKKITASFIGYTIAPRINAAGRIRDASLAVELFLAEDCETAAPIAKKLCDINRERQNEENVIIDQAYAQIDAEHDFENSPVIILSHESWHHGIIGIVASRITEKYNRPSILISFEGSGDEKSGEDFGKGSGRSIKGMNLVDALSACSDLLEKFGGHELAAGLTIKRENLPEFKKRLNKCARECFSDVDMQPSLEAECELTPADITMAQANELYYLEPYGVSNPVPVFVMRHLPLEEISLVGGGKHTRLSLKIGKANVNAMCFRQTLDDLCLYPGDLVDVMFTLDINEFQNQKSLQLIVKDIRLSEKEFAAENDERKLFRELRAGRIPTENEKNNFADVVPTHDDFAAVYSTIRRESRLEHEVFSLRALGNLLKSGGADIGYVKLRFIMLAFDELGILGIKELDEEKEIFAFKVIPVKGKTNLDKSNIYRKLKSDFGLKI
ncbi:MAG: single-stranded-DNA-specific exonuclease RecJ [Eubacteriales bacterium]